MPQDVDQQVALYRCVVCDGEHMGWLPAVVAGLDGWPKCCGPPSWLVDVPEAWEAHLRNEDDTAVCCEGPEGDSLMLGDPGLAKSLAKSPEAERTSPRNG